MPYEIRESRFLFDHHACPFGVPAGVGSDSYIRHMYAVTYLLRMHKKGYLIVLMYALLSAR